MVRQARMASPTKYYHIMMRGNNREKIFTRNEQKLFFMNVLKRLIEEEHLEIGAYCLMDNHVHLVAKGELADLSRLIKRLNIRYAMKYNKKNERVGHVFQDRYKSEVILDEPYLLHATRYVHNNPVKAGIVEHPRDYRWSSYQEYYKGGSENILHGEQRKFMMTFFNDDFGRFEEFHLEQNYSEFIDTEEDIELIRKQAANRIISDYCISCGLTNGKEVLDNSEYRKGLIREMLHGTRLSHRKIAEILGVSNNVVHKISLEE